MFCERRVAMSKYTTLLTIGTLLLAGCSKSSVEPSTEDILSAVPECASNACKDFKKIACQNAGDPDGLNGALFKCSFSYVPTASTSGDTKTDEKCLVNEGKGWRIGAAC